ncbi:GTP 3',8-cyclase MoaA [Hydrogenivirga sp.]
MEDRLGRTLRDIRISVTDRCNFRCLFCMPPDKDINFLPRRDLLTYEEIARLVRILTDLGVRKARITGGEPLMRAHLENLIENLSRVKGLKDIALTTNGYNLSDKAETLKMAGLRRITVSLTTLRKDKFTRIAGREVELDKVVEGIETAKAVGLEPVKVNTVVIRGVNDDEILDIAEFCRERNVTLRFIEFMDVGTLNGWNMEKVVPAEEIISILRRRYEIEEVGRSDISETSLKYRFMDTGQEFGIIASVTKPFCRGCTRLRLSADGRLFTCLFATEGYDVRALLRSDSNDEDIAERIRSLWTNREDRYSELRALERENPTKKVEMFRVGG